MPRFAKDRPRRIRAVLLAVVVSSLTGCDEYGVNAQTVIVREEAPHVIELIHEDIERARIGIRTCGERVAPGFAVTDPEQRRTEIRTALGMLRDIGRPRLRVPELVATPISFVAAVGVDGRVIARDPGEDRDAPDLMANIDVGALAPVRAALDEGVESAGLVDFPGFTADDPTLPLYLFAVPITRDGVRLGTVIGGIPLWRLAQKLSRQLQADAGGDMSVHWVYLYRGDEILHHGTPAELDEVIPDEARRTEGLATSPGGFTHGFMQHGRWYAWGVLPLPELGEGVGAVIVRSDPIE